MKIHTVWDDTLGLPDYMNITEAKLHDSKGLIGRIFPKGTIVVEDRAYFDFELFKKRIDAKNIFVTRLKSNILYESIEELDLPDDRDRNILKDELIKFTSKDVLKAGLEGRIFRLVTVYKEDENKVIHLITNQTDWQAITIANLYKKRWDIEIFFYDKYIIMQSKVRSIPDSQRLARSLLTFTLHNNSQCPRSLNQSRRSLLFSQILSESRLGTRSAYAFSSASRLAFESTLT